MSIIDVIKKETVKLGYREDALRWNYAYSDVWGATAATRFVPFAAFTQTPPSYRSAAFAVVEASHGKAAEIVGQHRSLGAPVFLVIEPDCISLWQVFAEKTPLKLGHFAPDAINRFFAERRESWAPDAIHRAKSIGRVDQQYQLHFVDIGLIPAIEGEIHAKLDRLIREAVAGSRHFTGSESIRTLFRGVFRLLAAKILLDRQHSRTQNWNSSDVRSVLNAMDDFYSLGNVSQAWPRSAIEALEPVWAAFRSGFNVANISADDLAYVYESTLVTDKARAEFGTHSTPRHMADYVVGQLRLWEFGATPPRVYEPFTGAGVFLVSALRYMRDALPSDWTDKQRHDLLVDHVGGAESDPFAVEVAKLSLILADYPNSNGWKVEEADLFEKDALGSRLSGANVILCNPPFAAFNSDELRAYPDAAAVNHSKAVFALEMALRAQPDMLGFVAPNTLLVDRRYREQRLKLERSYGEIEMVALPDGVFNVSQANTALLIARKPLQADDRQLIRSAVVLDKDKKLFATTGRPSLVREVSREPSDAATGKIWICRSQQLWDILENGPRLGSVLKGSWGLRWKTGQTGRTSNVPSPGGELGFQDTSSLRQFVLSNPQPIDVRPDRILAGANLAWDEPKILCNATRLSRGYWRLAAALDRARRRATQQFIGLWPDADSDVDLDALAAVINGPVVNAFMTEHSFDKRFRISALHDAPIPRDLPIEVGKLSREYASAAANFRSEDQGALADLLAKIDSLVLEAYGLSDGQKADLLAVFEDDKRPLAGTAPRRRRIQKSVSSDAFDDVGGLFQGAEVELDIGEDVGETVSRRTGERLLLNHAKTLPVADWAGEVLNSSALRDRLHISHDDFDHWQSSGSLIALPNGDAGVVYPVDQFVDGRPIEGLREVLEVVGRPRVAWLWLRTARPGSESQSPIELLKGGHIKRALLIAKRDFG